MKSGNKGSAKGHGYSKPDNCNHGKSGTVRTAPAGNQGTQGPITNKNRFPRGMS